MSRTVILLMFLLLSACQSTDKPKAPPEPAAPQSPAMGLGANAAYLPNGREEFEFAPQPELFQPFGYAGFCSNQEFCDNRLPYSLYEGKRGYFEIAEPVARLPEWDAYQVVLETGERYFYLASPALGGRYAPVAPIVPAVKAEEAERLRYKPLVQCSDTYVVESQVEFGTTKVRLSNGRSVTSEELGKIRSLANRYGTQAPSVAELLLDFQLQHEQELNRWTVHPVGELLDNDIRLYLVFGADKAQLRLMVKYMGEQWLYLRGLEFTADDRTWEARRLPFERTETQGRYQEWVDVAATQEDVRLVRRLAEAKKSVVRLEGRNYYDQLILSPMQKEDLLRLLQLYERLRTLPMSTSEVPSTC